MRTVTWPGRLIWGISGVATVAALAIPGTRLLTRSDDQPDMQQLKGAVTRTSTLSLPVTSVNVQSYGGSVQVTGSDKVSHVTVTETTAVPDKDISPPPVAATVRNGLLSVGSPACATWQNCVSFTVTVPRDVAVTAASDGGPVTVSGVAAVNLSSDGGYLAVGRISGPVTVSTGGGPLSLADVTGPLQADTSGGSIVASGITATTATITTDGGPAQLAGSIGTLGVYTGGGSAEVTLSKAPSAVTMDTGSGPALLAVPDTVTTPKVTVSTEGGYARITGSIDALSVSSGGGPAVVGLATAPDTVTVNTFGGSAALAVPGGPYALTTDSEGNQPLVTIATSPTAKRSITVTTAGGPLQIEP